MKKYTLPGQIGLILLVVMSAVVALIMSLASRSLSDTVLSRQEQESSASFNLAESGIEKALNDIGSNPSPGPGGTLSSFDSAFTGSFAVTGQRSYEMYVKEGEQAHIVGTTAIPSPLTVEWTKTANNIERPGTSCTVGSGLAPASLEFEAIQGAAGTATFSYYAARNCTLASNVNFLASQPATSPGFLSQISYTVPAQTTILRIRAINNDATIKITGSNLETQQFLVQSKAGGGDAQKEIVVNRGLDAPGSVFDFAIFTSGTIVK